MQQGSKRSYVAGDASDADLEQVAGAVLGEPTTTWAWCSDMGCVFTSIGRHGHFDGKPIMVRPAGARATAEAQTAAEKAARLRAQDWGNKQLLDALAAQERVAELRAALEPLIRARHQTAHNGDIYRGGNYETCPLCESVRNLLEPAAPVSSQPAPEIAGWGPLHKQVEFAAPASPRFLDLDAPTAKSDLADALRKMWGDPEYGDADYQAEILIGHLRLKEDRRGDTGPENGA